MSAWPGGSGPRTCHSPPAWWAYEPGFEAKVPRRGLPSSHRGGWTTNSSISTERGTSCSTTASSYRRSRGGTTRSAARASTARWCSPVADIYLLIAIAELAVAGVLVVRLGIGPSVTDRVVALSAVSTQATLALLF